MLLALDVAYTTDTGHAVALAFTDWPAVSPAATYTATVAPVAAYEPGAFYQRELPCLLAVLAQVELAAVRCLVVDGYVTLGDDARPGLGQHLYEALGGRLPVAEAAAGVAAMHGPHRMPTLLRELDGLTKRGGGT